MEESLPVLAPNSLPISCMVWNVQGAGSSNFIRSLKDLIHAHKPNVLVLVETHMGGDQAVKIANTIKYDGHERVDAMGFSGGIWVLWKTDLVTVNPILKHYQHITMEISRVGDRPWYFSAVYANPDPTKRKELWKELQEFARQNNEPWLVAGDFNDTRFPSERNTFCRETDRRSSLFNSWVEEMELVEVEFSGAFHTWARGRSLETRKSARLDRALCNEQWATRFDNAAMKHLPAIHSDHCPILISPNGFVPLQTLHRPFRFQATWMTHENFKEFVAQKWDNNSPLVPALSKLSKDLQDWNRDTFGNIFKQKRALMAIKGNDGEWIQDKERIKENIVGYFSHLFTEEGEPTRFDVSQDVFPELPLEQWRLLTRPYTHAEIDAVIKDMAALKAPGPDGYQALFYQKNWDLVASSVYRSIIPVLEGKGMPANFNDTFIALIPKFEKPELASQFRPIGLCNVAYKMVTKVLVNRIKTILPTLISNTQLSFVPGRQITDNIVIMQEVLHTMRRKQGKKGYMEIKIDFEKAYDRLRWSFIRDTLVQMNLPITMIEVIMECITTTSLQVLWNGEPSSSFKPSRGVRQGDPLSPYIFVMCMERLYQTIEATIVNGYWKPIRASREGPLLSNLFFADDIVLFAEATIDQASLIQACLERFCQASGQKQDIATTLGMEATKDLGLYLGMPTLTRRVTKDTYSHLCEKIDRRLAGWKSKYLSLAGRITLAKSTLSTMSFYSMQTAKVPRTITENIDRKLRRFIWGGNEDKNKVHILAWDTLQKPKDQGGIGISSAKQANAAFLTKLGWRVLTKPNLLWSRVLRAKYCKGRCDVDMFESKKDMSNVWCGITANAKLLGEGTQIAVGNGHNTVFWDHKWVGDTPLSNMATQPILQELEGATVAEMWEENSGWRWNIFAPFLPQDILKLIQNHELRVDPSIGDLVYWKGDSKGRFTIKSALRIMRQESDALDESCWDLIWTSPIQQRVRAFLWLACHNRVLCNQNMFRRNLTASPSCYICGGQMESTLYTLRDCPAAKVVWRKLIQPMYFDQFFQGSIKGWLEVNPACSEDHMAEDWLTIFGIAIWWIWRWRNCHVYNRKDELPMDIGAFLRIRVEEIKQSLTHDVLSPHQASHQVTANISWHPPALDEYVLNCDGAAKGCRGLAGGGGVIRNLRVGLSRVSQQILVDVHQCELRS
ncbi:uncharacterized protein LOC110685744 [Chenopodium quinoa]|uniref:uncharacterized protein LOC110685744 n=1 Tax=Chenopodium quinoa TaxID=63459 RepID=UPI000B76F704|nr:uncharacterized protein LOC110685744 [Chenopodium quinoa]